MSHDPDGLYDEDGGAFREALCERLLNSGRDASESVQWLGRRPAGPGDAV